MCLYVPHESENKTHCFCMHHQKLVALFKSIARVFIARYQAEYLNVFHINFRL